MKPVVFFTGTVVGFAVFYVWDEWCEFQRYVRRLQRR